jgi:hypothetical protein
MATLAVERAAWSLTRASASCGRCAVGRRSGWRNTPLATRASPRCVPGSTSVGDPRSGRPGRQLGETLIRRCQTPWGFSSTAAIARAAHRGRALHARKKPSLHTPGQHRADRAAADDRGMRGLPGDQGDMGASPHVPVLRAHRLMRQLAEPARQQARRRERPPDHPFRRARRDWSWCYVDEVAFVVRSGPEESDA